MVLNGLKLYHFMSHLLLIESLRIIFSLLRKPTHLGNFWVQFGAWRTDGQKAPQ